MARADVTFTKARAPLVLVVEDEIFLRYVTADYLEECGFAVLQAANADEAVGLLQRNRNVGAVFSDIQMPGSMNGLGLASRPPRRRNGLCLPSPTTWRRSSAGCAR